MDGFSLEVVVWEGDTTGAETLVHWLTSKCGTVENGVQYDLPRDERLAGSRR